jgi:pimeloyl-ACP methyl ester carboxylesterase
MPKRRWKIVTLFGGAVLLTLAVAGYFAATHAVALGVWAQQAVLESVLPEHDVFETERGEVHRYSGGEGPVLVLIHGFGDSAGGWVRLAPALVDHFRVVTLGLPGHGASGPSAPPLGFDDLEAGFEAALRDQGDELLLLGNSLGGWLATRFALAHPERVERLLLLNSGGASWSRADEDVLLARTRDQQRAKNRALVGDKVPPAPGFLLDQLIRHGRDPRLLSLWVDLERGRYVDAQLPELQTPVELLWGTPDPFFPVEGYADRLRDTLPDARLHLLEGCGHASQYSCPDDLANIIFEVLDAKRTD